MTRLDAYVFFIFGLCVFSIEAQVSVDCGAAIVICNNTPTNGGTNDYGVDDFGGADRSGCLEKTPSGTIESNSAWYRFKTSASGQMGFNISFDAAEDWDFALYKAADCNNLGSPVRCNFFDNSDANVFIGVGEDPSGVSNVQYEEWLQVAPGEEYFLLINNFSNLNSGFSIQFSGQIFVDFPNAALDCTIVTNLLGPPIAACDGDAVALDATVSNANSYSWYRDIGAGFEEIIGEVSAILDVSSDAIYRASVALSTGETLISDAQVSFSAIPTTNTLEDETVCQDALPFNLTTKNNEALGVQAADEFVVSYHSSSADAINNRASLPVQYEPGPGLETIYVRTASLKNPNCFDVSQDFTFTTVETPVTTAATEVFLCEDVLVATIGEPNPSSSYSYSWDTGETTPFIDVDTAGMYRLTITNTQATVSCLAIIEINVFIGVAPEITNVIIEDLSDNNTVTIETTMAGNFEYQLDAMPFQDSNVFQNVAAGAHSVTVNDKNGCGFDTQDIVVVGFANFFSPNGDGVNDGWKIEGMSSLEDAEVTIYDRYGKLLKQLVGNQDWDGTFNGKTMPESDYWFKLSYKNEVGDRVVAKYVNNHFALKR